MPGDPTPAPAAAADPFQRVLEALEADPAALGERLMVLGSGPIAVRGALGGILALDSRGTGVLVAAFATLPEGASSDLADELDRLALSGAERLSKTASNGEIGRTHSEFFSLSQPPALNRRQQAVVVLGDRPGLDTWKDLRADLGPALGGVFTAEETLTEQPSPKQLVKGTSRRWVVAAALVFGIVGFFVGRALQPEAPPIAPGPLISTGTLVAAGVGSDATHTQWIGQRRLVRLSDGHLVAGFVTGDGLQIVKDQLNQGKSWQGQLMVPQIHPVSFSMAVDSNDRIHVAFRDAQGVGYLYLVDGPDGITPSPIVRLAEEITSPVVDVGVDSTNNLAHVVWVSGETDQQPVWAEISAPLGGAPTMVRSEPLAGPGNQLTVLVNVGVAPDGQVIATYRKGDSATGWFARYLTGGTTWSPEEKLPTPDVLYGAASLAVDSAGSAHLVLRDNTEYGLTYLKRFDGVWGAAETVVDATVTEEIDFPSISSDETSEIVYVGWMDTKTTGKGQVKVASRDPAAGWSAAAGIESPDGLLYPTGMSSVFGSNVFLATAQGAGPQILAFRASAG